MTQTKFEIQKRKGLKIDAGVRRGPQGGKQVGAQGKRNAAGSKLLGALLGVPSDEKTVADAASTTPNDPKKPDSQS
ncbi:hypothetical protein [Pandoraea apista]|uniref:Uncharacterized protein n=1 Tax=Pandoraea apista TaxID=93218 RepID=A0A0G4JK84_9BURK|nr:hypothetical protein [Pandoraea apista]ALS64051.1 hypothetical protein AT395_02660 [Pandoraea apista]OXS89413.1 hypothetical protein B7H01_19065 [Pandoraea apista]RRW98758.1 hypothetical protein EGJ54_04855 [Pandoraea apista]RRX05385.1 hypothetical protein EGJ56_08270 [Pandoraea apista]CFB63641.1 hypothetical protein LMG16407_03725 [Pandoraea apista]